MYIENINGPEDVKKLSDEQLNVLAEEIRKALLEKLSKHGGHFGPNFGMVEATIAMHMYLNHQKIRSYMTFLISLTHTRC